MGVRIAGPGGGLKVARRKPARDWSSRAERNIAWCEEHLHLPEGRFVGQPLRLPEFMRDDFRAIYDNEHGTRRAIISRGRKNAKTCECAFILLLHLCGPEHRLNGQLFSCAQSRDQAAVLFHLAAKIIRLSPKFATSSRSAMPPRSFAARSWGRPTRRYRRRSRRPMA